MGKKEERQFQAYLQALQSAIAQGQKASPYENALSAEWQATRNWLDKKDYRNTPAGVNIPLLPLADYKRFASYGRPSNTGAGATNQLAMQNMNQLSNDQLTRDWGSAYENAVGGLMDRNDNLAGMLQNSYTNRMNLGVTGANQVLQSWLNRPKSSGGGFWKGLAGGLAQAAPAIISAI